MFRLLHKTALPLSRPFLVKPDPRRIWSFRIPPFPLLLLVLSEILIPVITYDIDSIAVSVFAVILVEFDKY